jgi:hypothetical protein
MTLSTLFIDSTTYWLMLVGLALISLSCASWIHTLENIVVEGICTLITIVSGVLLIGFIYYAESKMIIYDDQVTIDIREQSAKINGTVLTTGKNSSDISASSQWLNAVDEKLPKLVGRLDNETEKRDLTFCVKKSKQDLFNVTSIVGTEDDKQVLLDNPLITCLKDKGYKFKSQRNRI